MDVLILNLRLFLSRSLSWSNTREKGRVSKRSFMNMNVGDVYLLSSAPSVHLIQPYLRDLCLHLSNDSNHNIENETTALSGVFTDLANYAMCIVSAANRHTINNGVEEDYDNNNKTNHGSTNNDRVITMLCGTLAYMAQQMKTPPDVGASPALLGLIHLGFAQMKSLEATRSDIHGYPLPLILTPGGGGGGGLDSIFKAFHLEDCFLWLSVALLCSRGPRRMDYDLPETFRHELASLVEFVFQHIVRENHITHELRRFPFLHEDLPIVGQLKPVQEIPFETLLMHLEDLLTTSKEENDEEHKCVAVGWLSQGLVLSLVRTLTCCSLLLVSGCVPPQSAASLGAMLGSVWERVCRATSDHCQIKPSSVQFRLDHVLMILSLLPSTEYPWVLPTLQERIREIKEQDRDIERHFAVSLYEIHTLFRLYSPKHGSKADELKLWVGLHKIFSSNTALFPTLANILQQLIAVGQEPNNVLSFTVLVQGFLALVDDKAAEDAQPLSTTGDCVPLNYLTSSSSPSYAADGTHTHILSLISLSSLEPSRLRYDVMARMVKLEWARPIMFYAHICLESLQRASTTTILAGQDSFGDFAGSVALSVQARGFSDFVVAYFLQFTEDKAYKYHADMASHVLW